MAGTIVKPRGGSGSGWHQAFLPDGSSATVAEMAEGSGEREASLPRGAAIRALEVSSKESPLGGGSCRPWCLLSPTSPAVFVHARVYRLGVLAGRAGSMCRFCTSSGYRFATTECGLCECGLIFIGAARKHRQTNPKSTSQTCHSSVRDKA